MSFVPIKLGDYVRLFLKSNPGENAKEKARGFEKRLRRTRPESGAIAASRSGSSARRKPGTPASRASQGKRIRRKTTRSPRHATRPVSPLGAVVGTPAHTSSMCPCRVTPPARTPLPATPRRPRHPQIPPSTKASPTTTCRSKIPYALEHGQETAAAYLPAGEEAVPPTKHGDAIVCATTACLRARLGTLPIRSRAQRAPRQGADAQLLMAFCLNSIRTDFDRQEGCPASRNRDLKPIAVSGPRKKALSGPIRGSYSSQP